MKHSLLIIGALLCASATHAQTLETTIDGVTYRLRDSETLLTKVSKYDNSASEVTILPEVILYKDNECTVTAIGYNAFKNCDKVTKVNIPSTVVSYDGYAFYGCSNLTDIEISASVQTIGSYAFAYCSSLSKIVIPNTVKELGSAALRACTSLTDVSLPESLSVIGSNEFYGCSSLTKIVIPETVQSIGGYAFSGCTSLVDVNIPEKITTVEKGTFMNCTSLTTITIPKEVAQIDLKAFSGCTSLKTIYTNATVPPAIGDDVFTDVPADATIFVPTGCIEAYQAADGWKQFSDFRETGTTGIEAIGAEAADSATEYFTLNGTRVDGNALTPGIYIKRTCSNTCKIIVK